MKRPKTKSDAPLYETIIGAVKSEMGKSKWVRDKTIVMALQSVQIKYSKYWRITGQFPDDQVAGSLLIDVIREKEKELDKSSDLKKDNIERQIEYLNNFVPENFTYVFNDMNNLKPCDTNVKWKLYHNPTNITITDKRQLRSIK